MAVPAGHHLREIRPWFVVVSDTLVPTELHAHYAVSEALIGVQLYRLSSHIGDATALDSSYPEPSMSSTAMRSSEVSSKRPCRHSPGQPTSTRSLSVASRRSARFSPTPCAQQSWLPLCPSISTTTT